MYQYEEKKKGKPGKKGSGKTAQERAGTHVLGKGVAYGTAQAPGRRQVIQRIPIPKEAAPYVDSEGVYTELVSEYVLSEDVVHIGRETRQQNAAVSVRKTGGHSLKMLKRGAGAKGHDILDKTIKESSLGCAAGELEQKLREQGLPENISGLVARWDQGTITGLYLTSVGKHRFQDAEGYQIEDGKILSLRSAGEKARFARLVQREKGWESYFYTGDYDLHDMVSFTSQRHSVPSESGEEKSLIAKLNRAMTGELPAERQHIRHGPSVNYIAHNLDREPGEKIVEVVARIAPPVAMCNRGNWSVLQNQKEIVDWYFQNNIKIKITWSGSQEGEERIRSCVENTSEICMAVNAVNGMGYKGKKVLISPNPFCPADTDRGIVEKLNGLDSGKRERYLHDVVESYKNFIISELVKSKDSRTLIRNLKNVGGIKEHGEEILAGKGELKERLERLTWLQLHMLYLYQQR